MDVDKSPTSSWRCEKSGISTRDLTPRLTLIAASDSFLNGDAIVLARSADSTRITIEATKKIRKIPTRSSLTILSI